jgi:nitrilase
VAQVRSQPDTATAIKVVEEIAGQAAADGVQLIVFPEALLGGYPRGAAFGAVVGDRSATGREEFLAYSRQAVVFPGPEIEQLTAIAAEYSIHMVVGFIERAGTSLYCATVTLDGSGAIIGRRRKVMPTGTERLIWAMGDGSTLTVAKSQLGNLATVICWENLMPALRLNFYAQGVDIWCAPTADARDVQLATMRHIAIEGRCFVLAANQFAQAKDLSPVFATTYDDPEQTVCRGASVIVNPYGDVVAGPLHDQDGLLVANLDLDDVARGRYDFDAAGHYSRPDIFTLHVDREERSVILP